ncbi:MAG: methyltransferase domain-containing protein, partial [Asticcacaulis sp.]|nr:methyltransferase domain-containing protein [Asticcacaulis sp.]
MTAAPDHFSRVAGQYAAARPTYPAALFDWLADVAPGRDLAWDAGAGSGQASLALAERFGRVLATDISAGQLSQMPSHDRIVTRVTDYDTGLDDASVDLVTVAQALHWFDLDAFYGEVRRVLKPGGVIAVWTYAMAEVDGAGVDAELMHLYADVVGDYWPAERVHVENGYADLPFPFEPIAAPPFAITLNWTLAQYVAYPRSWSATGRMIEATGENP